MSFIGIIAEFNPLHTGHKFLIDEAKKHGKVVCVISGNFVQRGDTAIFEKTTRTEMALRAGADLVIELPVCYSMSTAQSFALGGVAILESIGCDTLIFGSECGDISVLEQTADILSSKDFLEKLPTYLDQGITFAKARQLAAEECGAKANVLDNANNNLGIEYILAAKALKSNLRFKTVTRKGAKHDSDELDNDFISASLVREKIKNGDIKDIAKYLPNEIESLYKTANYSDIGLIENAILSLLRTKTANELSRLPDLSEGIENKLLKSIKTATSLEMLYNDIKVKRYTLARIRRLVLSAFLGIDKRKFSKIPPYLRVLGFNKTGEEIIKQNTKASSIPVCLRQSDIENLSETAKYVFEIENRATDLYALSLKQPLGCGIEYTRKITKI